MSNQSFDFPLLILITSQIIGLCFFVWRIAIKYGDLNSRVEQNRHDLNNLSITIREAIRDVYQINKMEIGHIQEHLVNRDGYHPPSLKIWDKNFDD